jgi:hypothetical protein
VLPTDPNAPPASFEEMWVRISGEAIALCCQKQRDYGPGNIPAFGVLGVLVRLNDKVERLKNLINSNKDPEYESIEDTLLDLVNYSMIGIAVRRGWWTSNSCPPLLEQRG